MESNKTYQPIIQMQRAVLIKEIIKLSNLLDKQYYAQGRFRNHCYLRIAYDKVCNDKWDLQVKRPFIENAPVIKLNQALDYLKQYKVDYSILIEDNIQSLRYRKQ